MTSKQVIYYENLYCKVNFKYKTVLQDDFEIIDLKDIERERQYCFGSDHYIKNFIEVMKERVIKKLPDLNKIKIILGAFDKDNIWHRFMIVTVQMLFKILKIKREINFYKSVFVIIKYENHVVFMGDLNFEGIE